MEIREKIDHAKILLNEGLDLMLLRLRLLHLDLSDQAANFLRIAAALLVCAVLLLVALISLLFGLNRILDGDAALWTFFGISAGTVLLIALLLLRLSAGWRKQSSQIAATLQDIRTDLAYLRGEAERPSSGEPS
ncbi:phage holin family protein [Bergeriella denitrificans]|uniref:Protein of uncharacterized function (DUF1469) n=1 Tax=Bergeriella denitrificans TaxID=494 RepID=A0A378UEL9_BERDE|nr:phage holin family protein [Bergeriella denitrificans]STZ75755.1 Protein of uncharacterised function (DUF1469) [Bergeriella denitrificans]